MAWGISVLLQDVVGPLRHHSTTLFFITSCLHNILVFPGCTAAAPAAQPTAARLMRMSTMSQPAKPVGETLHPATEPSFRTSPLLKHRHRDQLLRRRLRRNLRRRHGHQLTPALTWFDRHHRRRSGMIRGLDHSVPTRVRSGRGGRHVVQVILPAIPDGFIHRLR